MKKEFLDYVTDVVDAMSKAEVSNRNVKCQNPKVKSSSKSKGQASSGNVISQNPNVESRPPHFDL